MPPCSSKPSVYTHGRHLFTCTAQHFGAPHLTWNLHYLVDCLCRQATRMGDTVSLLEMWVERLVQFIKAIVKQRAMFEPEKVAANNVGLLNACHSLLPYGEAGTQVASLARPEVTHVVPPGRRADVCDEQGSGSVLLGDGVRWEVGAVHAGLSRVLFLEKAEGVVKHNAIAGWDGLLGPEANVELHVFEGVCVCGAFIASSVLNTRARATSSTHVLVPYEGGQEGSGSIQGWVAEVQAYVLVTAVDQGSLMPLRLALVDFYNHLPAIEDEDYGVILRACAKQGSSLSYAVPVDCIESVLCYTFRRGRGA